MAVSDLYFQSGMFLPIFDFNQEWNLDIDSAADRIRFVLERFPPNKTVMILGAIYYPLLDHVSVVDPLKKNRKISAIESAIVRNLKYSVEVGTTVMTLLKGASLIEGLINSISRLSVGRFIRSVGRFWKLTKFVCFNEDVFNYFVQSIEPFAEEQGLTEAYDLKPLIRGDALAKLHGIKPGKDLQILVQNLFDWQLCNPGLTSKDYEVQLHQ